MECLHLLHWRCVMVGCCGPAHDQQSWSWESPDETPDGAWSVFLDQWQLGLLIGEWSRKSLQAPRPRSLSPPPQCMSEKAESDGRVERVVRWKPASLPSSPICLSDVIGWLLLDEWQQALGWAANGTQGACRQSTKLFIESRRPTQRRIAGHMYLGEDDPRFLQPQELKSTWVRAIWRPPEMWSSPTLAGSWGHRGCGASAPESGQELFSAFLRPLGHARGQNLSSR